MGNYSPELKELIRIAKTKHQNQDQNPKPKPDRTTAPKTPDEIKVQELLLQNRDAATIILIMKDPKITAQIEKIIRQEVQRYNHPDKKSP